MAKLIKLVAASVVVACLFASGASYALGEAVPCVAFGLVGLFVFLGLFDCRLRRIEVRRVEPEEEDSGIE